MSIKLELKTWVNGRRRILFERLKKSKDASTAQILRDVLDFYYENNPNIK